MRLFARRFPLSLTVTLGFVIKGRDLVEEEPDWPTDFGRYRVED